MTTGVDIGSPSQAGSDSLSGGTYTVNGVGTFVTGSSDQCHLVYQSYSGDGTLIARLVTQQLTASFEQAGIMIRLSTAANAAAVTIYHFDPAHASSEYGNRTSNGGSLATAQVGAVNVPWWLRIIKTGTSFAIAHSADGSTWTTDATVTNSALTGTLLWGLFATAGNTSSVSACTFDNVSLPGGSSPVHSTIIQSSSMWAGQVSGGISS